MPLGNGIQKWQGKLCTITDIVDQKRVASSSELCIQCSFGLISWQCRVLSFPFVSFLLCFLFSVCIVLYIINYNPLDYFRIMQIWWGRGRTRGAKCGDVDSIAAWLAWLAISQGELDWTRDIIWYYENSSTSQSPDVLRTPQPFGIDLVQSLTHLTPGAHRCATTHDAHQALEPHRLQARWVAKGSSLWPVQDQSKTMAEKQPCLSLFCIPWWDLIGIVRSFGMTLDYLHVSSHFYLRWVERALVSTIFSWNFFVPGLLQREVSVRRSPGETVAGLKSSHRQL